MSRRSIGLKPGAVTRTVYVPGTKLGAEYNPALSVVKARDTPRATSVIATAALGTTEPLESVTAPEI